MKRRFIFDENYNKKRSKKGMSKLLLILAVLLILIIIIIIVMLIVNRNKEPVELVNNKPVFELKENITIESGSALPSKEDYFLKLENIDLDSINLSYPVNFEVSYNTDECSEEELANSEDISSLACVKQNLITPASYGILITINDEDYVVPLIVKDTTSPLLVTNDLEIYSGDEYVIEDFINLCYDLSNVCEASYVDEEYGNLKDGGEYTIEIIATDKYDNVTENTTAKLTIIAPEKEVYTVTFDSDGGSLVEDQKVEEGSLANEITTTKDGYNFLGWYLNDDKYDFNTPITGDITLKAKWEEIVTEEPVTPGENTEEPETPKVIAVTSVTLNYSKKYLIVGETFTLNATVRPSNATNKSVSWSSSDSSIVSVENGKLTAKKEGTVTITATAEGKSATTTVIVTSGTTCTYGDTSYNTNLILSVNLTQNNCAINPNSSYNESLSTADYVKLANEVKNLGLTISTNNIYTYTKVYNNSGTGLVGVQIFASVTASNGKKAEYVLKSDGTRVYLTNELGL